ncbi:MAG TPA: LemA family protein [Bacilli bacterium]|nr:LemA family protein [Bacilli bacterium]
MNLAFYIILSFIIIVGLLLIAYLNVFNKIQRLKIKIDEAETIIDDMLRDRYDLLLEINSILTTTLKKDYFKDLINLKSKKISNFDMDRQITEAVSLFSKIKNDNKDLNNNEKIKSIELNLKNNEEKLEAAKAYFNMNTSKLNELIKTFPSMIVARMHGIKIRTYFDGKNLNDEDINDFKL